MLGQTFLVFFFHFLSFSTYCYFVTFYEAVAYNTE